MFNGTLVVVLLGFLGTIGVIVWSEHRQTRVLNARIDELKSDYEKDMAEVKLEMRAQDERHRVLEGKVDRFKAVSMRSPMLIATNRSPSLWRHVKRASRL